MGNSNKKSLNARQISILKYIDQSMSRYGYPPSIREIATAVGLKSTSTVFIHLEAMEKMGLVKRDDRKKWSLVKNEAAETVEKGQHIWSPVVGEVAAGIPILAEENITDYFPLPTRFGDEGDVFMLQVVGDSMIDAGIREGDYVIVRKQQTADNGSIVVALIDNEATVKTFYDEGRRARLQPQNSAYEPIYTEDLMIIGIVKGLLRVY